MREIELRRHRGWLAGLPDDQRAHIEVLSRGIVNKILHQILSELHRNNGVVEGIYAGDVARHLLGSYTLAGAIKPAAARVRAGHDEPSELAQSRMPRQLRIGSRPSRLALAQAQIVKSAVEQTASGLACEIVAIRTVGDKLTTPSLAGVVEKGLFVHELEQALAAGRIDIAVHSMKGMPALLEPGFRLLAVPAREDTADLLLTRGPDLTNLPQGARLGTSSVRRRFQAARRRSDLEVRPLRGNIDTRLARLGAGDFDAIILAAAGLKRLGQSDVPSIHRLDEDDFVPAGGQGALAIEAIADRFPGASAEIERAIAAMDDMGNGDLL